MDAELVPAPNTVESWRPPPLTPQRAQQFATELRRHREALADIRHALEGFDQGETDDAANMAAKSVADTLWHLDFAVRWLTGQ